MRDLACVGSCSRSRSMCLMRWLGRVRVTYVDNGTAAARAVRRALKQATGVIACRPEILARLYGVRVFVVVLIRGFVREQKTGYFGPRM